MQLATQKMIAGLALVLLWAVWPGPEAHGVTYYVTTSGVDDAGTDGLTWGTAFASIRYAAATRAAADDTVLVSNGTYNVTAATGIGKNLTVKSLNGSQHTFLNGGGVGSFGAFTTGGATNTIVLRGLTMTNFFAGNGVVSVSGATNLWYIYDCVFAENSVNVGGSVCISHGGNVANMYDCVIRNNYARGECGGGVYIYGTTYSPPVAGILRAHRCTIVSNSTAQDSSSGQAGAGIYMLEGAVCELDECRIIENSAGIGRGGGISGGSVVATVSNCVIAGNSAPGGHGGAYLTGAGVKISSSRITNNIVSNGTVGGLYLSGGIIENSLIAGNRASGRAGGADLSGNTIMRNCTVVGNTGGDRGGLDRGPASAINTIVYFNTGGVSSNYNRDDSIYYTNCCTAPIPTKGTDTIPFDPRLVAFPENCRLQKGSPCINAGMNQDWMNGALDLDGRKRVVDGMVDMGAYEWFPKGALIMFQ